MLTFLDGKTVLVTGNTGFKGCWLTELLRQARCRVVGYALAPETVPALYTLLDHGQHIQQVVADIRDRETLRSVVASVQPDFVFHLAAQPLVRRSYSDPITTLETNVMGTAYLLDALQQLNKPCAVVIVTTDKVYAVDAEERSYCEGDRLGGKDPYSVSKACAELVTHGYRAIHRGPCAIATVRAGNVLGGGDWSADRLIPDLMRAYFEQQGSLRLRYPEAVRPWQHVLDPLAGYLMLAAALAEGQPESEGAWNFGPDEDSNVSVREVVVRASEVLGSPIPVEFESGIQPAETGVLRLNSARSRRELGWYPKLDFDNTIAWTVDWYREFYAGANVEDLMTRQILAFCGVGAGKGQRT